MRPWLAFWVGLVLVIAMGIFIGAVTPVPAQVSVGGSTVLGGALFVWAQSTSRKSAVEQQFPGFHDAFEVILPCERTVVGGPRIRLFGAARRLWAPGLLGVTRGAAAFLPQRATHGDRAWGGDVDSFEVGSILGQGSYLRLHTPDGDLQFALQMTARDLADRVEPWLTAPTAVEQAAAAVDPLTEARVAADVDPSTGTNLRVLNDVPEDPRTGDVFALAPPGEAFLFGRVITTQAQWTRGEGPASAVLIYLYDEWSLQKRIPDPETLRPDLLLVPPILTNLLAWRQGIFQTLGNAPLGPGDVLETHCFRSPDGRYYDGFGQELPGPVEPVGTLGLHSFRSIDDVVSDAIGIPRAP